MCVFNTVMENAVKDALLLQKQYGEPPFSTSTLEGVAKDLGITIKSTKDTAKKMKTYRKTMRRDKRTTQNVEEEYFSGGVASLFLYVGGGTTKESVVLETIPSIDEDSYRFALCSAIGVCIHKIRHGFIKNTGEMFFFSKEGKVLESASHEENHYVDTFVRCFLVSYPNHS